MLNIYTAAVTRHDSRTLLAKGDVWEELVHLLRSQDKTHLLTLVLDQLPATFSRDEIVRVTLPIKFSRQVLEVAGLSS